MDSHEKVKYLDIVIYRYIKSVLKQNEVKKETTHPPPPKTLDEAALTCSRCFCFVTQWGGALQKETKMAARETRMKPPMTSLKTPSHPCLKLGGGGGGGKFLVYFVQPTLFLSWCQHLTLDVIGSLRTRTVTSSESGLSVLLENI